MNTDQDSPLATAEALFQFLEETRKEHAAFLERLSAVVPVVLQETERRFAVLAKADPEADNPPWVRYQGRYAKGLEKMIRASFEELLTRQKAHHELTRSVLAGKTDEAISVILSALRTAAEKPVVTPAAPVIKSGE